MNEGPGAIGVAAALLGARRLIAASAVGLAAIACGVTLLSPRQWTVEVSFIPETRLPTGGLVGLAEQFGVRGLPAESGNSPEFYADLVRSRQILVELAAWPVHAADGQDGGVTIAEALGTRGADAPAREADVLRRLRRAVGALARPRTGLVEVRVTTRSAALSQEIADRVLTLVDRYNAERRQSRAGAERRFAEQQLAEANAALAEAEAKQEAFVVTNRRYPNDPQLLFQFEKLGREVAMRQQVVIGLAGAHEQARLDEVRDTPVLSRVQQPYRPARPDPRGTPRVGVVALLLGGALGALAALARAAWRRALDADPTAARQLTEELGGLRSALARRPRPRG